MNEVVTLGTIHHVHLVHLMGYCFEGFRSALVYEYMANGSLEKFLFQGKEQEQKLSWEQLYSIALDAASGITYLHQDCNRRIIHFDIKPHNILVDADFMPKVVDFGLTKLYGKGDDHVSITATRGTPGMLCQSGKEEEHSVVGESFESTLFSEMGVQIDRKCGVGK
ncbi:hypothetical protein SUGI_0117090 [Cryptomeria japonica]|nr:hypothetical protein SUGI_0117090 [Cryptomeria japonica]